MEAYIFAGDAAGEAVAEALCERARAGLDVRLMIDAFGSFSMPGALMERLRHSGVRLHVFHSLLQIMRGPRFLQAFNQRNHRKLLVVDQQVAYFGGMNVVDQSGIHSKDDAKARRLPVSAGWRDVQVRMVGPRQAEIAEMMERLWQRVHHEPRSQPPATGVCPIFPDARGGDLLFRLAPDAEGSPAASGAGAAAPASATARSRSRWPTSFRWDAYCGRSSRHDGAACG